MNNIVFIGFMGVGKSTIAYRLSKMKNMEIIDTDKEIENRTKMTVSEIFETHGEEWFRDQETNLLKELKDLDNTIISCGGGIVLRKENRLLLKEVGCVILLSANVYTIHKRVNMNDRRPLLKEKKSKEYIAKVLKERKKFYDESADIKVTINHKTVPMICNEVIRKLKEKEINC
ncbi:MAG TPA: shikimate kinase [Candidatus Dorea intestinavium]|nr:shikimate kinase [Candidatus Dorea intestinavium]